MDLFMIFVSVAFVPVIGQALTAGSFCRGEITERKPEAASSFADFDPCVYATAAAAIVGAGVAVAAAPVVLGAMGFTSAGIAANSIAAGMMSTAAAANGGGVVAGSAVAVGQSLGAAGLSTTASAFVGAVGATLGGIVGKSACAAGPSTTSGENDQH